MIEIKKTPFCVADGYKSLLKFLRHKSITKCLCSGLLNARTTLRILDIEHSVLISDECLPLILQFTGLTQIGVAKTKLSSEGQAMIIKSLKHLVLLLRGDFLCDALGKYHNVVWSLR